LSQPSILIVRIVIDGRAGVHQILLTTEISETVKAERRSREQERESTDEQAPGHQGSFPPISTRIFSPSLHQVSEGRRGACDEDNLLPEIFRLCPDLISSMPSFWVMSVETMLFVASST
jgi:hypothetical protein